MNRRDREITDIDEIVCLLERCDTIRLGLTNGESPYVVPVSFGLDRVDDKVTLYFHGAKRGQKANCINQNPNVCIEADIFYRVEPWQMGITTRYESVIGFGRIQELTCHEEKLYGLYKLLEHYHYADYPVDLCKGLQNTSVYKIILQSITGKRNLPII